MSTPASATADAVPERAERPVEADRSRSRVWARLRTHPSALVGLAIFAAYVLAAVLGPLLFRYDPIHQNLSEALLPCSTAPATPWSWASPRSPSGSAWGFPWAPSPATSAAGSTSAASA